MNYTIEPKAVLRNAKKREKEKRRQDSQNQYFAELYDNLNNYELPKPQINMNRYFNFAKDIMKCGFYQQAMAVYPVLCSQADLYKNHPFQISEQNIALLAGMNEAGVRAGISELVSSNDGFYIQVQEGNVQEGNLHEFIPILHRVKVQESRRRYWTYEVGMVRGDLMQAYEYFPFYHCIIEMGIWAKLMARAKILYLSMRCRSHFNSKDEQLYRKIEGEQTSFENRKWEVCTETLSELCRLGNISNRNLQPVLAQLEKFRLIERFDRWMKVWLYPWPDNPSSNIDFLKDREKLYQHYGRLMEKLQLDKQKKYQKIHNKT